MQPFGSIFGIQFSRTSGKISSYHCPCPSHGKVKRNKAKCCELSDVATFGPGIFDVECFLLIGFAYIT